MKKLRRIGVNKMNEHTCPECKNITWTCTNNGEDYFQCDCLPYCNTCYKQNYFKRAERLEEIGIDFDNPQYDEYMNVNYL